MAADALLLDLYACAGEPARWSLVLDRLCAETGACSAVLQAFSFDGSGLRMHWSVQDSRGDRHQALYATRIANEGNPRLDPQRAARGLNRVARDEDLFDPWDGSRLALQAQLATLGLGRFIGVLQQRCGDTYLGLALHRAVNDDDDFSAAQVARLSELAPHFGQVFELGDRIRTATEFDRQLQRHLDQLRCGLIMCDGRARVRWMNGSAGALLASDSALRLHAGQLLARTSASTEILMREIATAAAGANGSSRYLALGHGDRELHVAMQAVNAAGPSARGGDSVLLAVTGPAAPGEIPPAALTKLFGLTPAESRLVGALVTGSTLDQYSQHRGVSMGTTRGQLKQALAKTGATRQAELVRIVLSSAAAQLLGTESTALGCRPRPTQKVQAARNAI